MMNYHVLHMIGEGSFGRVYKGRKRFSGQVVALKFIPKVGRSEKELRNLRREIEIMRGLRHPNIIQMLDSLDTDKEVVVVTDYAEGELFQILEDDGSLPEEQVRDIACQLVSALYYLHSHRILHRDMKPQNILLGKGGVLKLCDFGFARAMSLQTLVLTSIKGTPLYMSPELVEEKPYDHTSDLWSLGCILYELYVGTPPFYTNSIFQLVSIIIKDPVKWPKGISADFKSFLQGLLTKDPRQRLSWPALLYHPFVADRVVIVADTVDSDIESPFTVQPSPELQALKEQQAITLAPKSGQSKILKKARQRMLEESKRKDSDKPRLPRTQSQEPGQKQSCPAPVPAAQPLATQQLAKSGDAAVDWSPVRSTQVAETGAVQVAKRSAEWETEQVPLTAGHHQINQNYEREFPEVQIGSGTLRSRSHNMENVDLDNEEMDSDEEWEQLIEATDPSGLQLSTPLTLLRDQAFQQRVHARLGDSSTQVLEGMLEGASRLRPVLRVIANLLTTRCDWELLHAFCQRLDLPQFLLQLIGQMVQSEGTKQQPWCGTVLCDLVTVLTAYFSGDFEAEASGAGSSIQVFEQSAAQFLQALDQLLTLSTDFEMRLKEQSIRCLMFLCETMDHSSPAVSSSFYSHLLCSHQAILTAVLRGCDPDPRPVQRPKGSAEDVQAARERWDRQLATNTATLAALCNVSPGGTGCRDAKSKVAEYISDTLFTVDNTAKSIRFIDGIQHQSLCLSVLKVLYSCCQVRKAPCQLLVDEALESLLLLLQSEVFPDDPVLSQTVELTLYLLSLLVIQLDRVAKPLQQSVGTVTTIFLRSHSPAHTSAVALLLIHLSSRGSPVEVHTEDLLQTIHSALVSTIQLLVAPPMNLGVFDGLLTLLLQFVSEGEPAALRDFADSELWNVIWHRITRVLQLTGDGPVMEGETPRPGQPPPTPDWNILSPSGILVFLDFVTLVFTAVPYQCLPLMASQTSVVMATFRQLLSDGFLDHLGQRLELLGASLGDACVDVEHTVVLRVCQLFCFPFAMDLEEPLFSDILLALLEAEIVQHLVQVILHCLPLPLAEIPVSLLCRLTLSGEAFVDQFVSSWHPGEASAYLSALLQSRETPTIAELLSLLGQVARASGQNLPFLTATLGGPGLSYQPLQQALDHPDKSVRAKACGLAGKLLGQGQGGDRLLEKVLERLWDDDPGVRGSASFAAGNAAFRAGSAPQAQATLVPALPRIVGLLDDPRPRTRRNAASALGNLGSGSGQLGRGLLRAGAPQRLLELACRDSQACVREAALAALRAMSQWPQVREVLISLRSCEKLSLMCQRMEQKATLSGTGSVVSPRSSAHTLLHHCNRLRDALTPTLSD